MSVWIAHEEEEERERERRWAELNLFSTNQKIKK